MMRLFALLFLATLFPMTEASSAEKVRSIAVVDLDFEGSSADVPDRAAVGKSRDNGKLVNGARRVPSPFWNQSGRSALLLNSRRKQYVRISDSPDIDRPAGVTISFFFLNLHPLNDAATHGIFGKRIDGGNKTSTNFGINYIGRSDSIRPYINDGSGFKYPNFSLKQTVGSRRLVYLTATFEVGDAPGADVDTDKDDVRIRFFVNGKQIKPKNPVGVLLRRNDAWATNVNFKRLINNVPLTLGSTNETIEFTSGLIDEFTLFDRALTPKQVSRLFREVAGPNAAKLAAEERRPPRSPVPQVSALSTRGLQIGATMRLVVTGTNLGANPVVRLPLSGMRQKLHSGAVANRAVFDLTIPKTTPPGFYPFRIQSEDGLGAPLTIAIDHLSQRSATGSSVAKPSVLPAAFSGAISGSARQRIYFRGKAGQRIVADVEARRLGGSINPVVEIKSQRGTPLVIAWGKVQLQGDTRAETVLPADGIYFVELHDLEFKAPGRNAFRLKIGDLKIADAWYPPAISGTGKRSLRPIGTGFRPSDQLIVRGQQADFTFLTKQRLASGPQPLINVNDATEFVEPIDEAKTLKAIDSTFKPGESRIVAINGIVMKPGESDRYLLNVAGGRKLRFTFLGRAIDSPIDGEVTVRALPQRQVLAMGEDRPGSRDPIVDVAVPAKTKQIEVTLRDLHGRGGRNFLYRLRVEPAGRPNFSLDVTSARLIIPAKGSGFVQLRVNRTGYNGPIKLAIGGDDSLSLLPDTIPAGRSGPVFVVVRHRGNAAASDFRHVRLVGTSVGLKPEIRRTARVTNRTQTVVGWETDLPMAIGRSSPWGVNVTKLPKSLFKGTRGRITVKAKRDEKLAGDAVRLSLISTERRRLRNPKNPKQGNKPLVRSFPGQAMAANATETTIIVATPTDVADSEIEFIVRADLVPHPYSARVIATAFSQPFRLPVKSAVTVTVDGKSQSQKGGTPGTVRGTIRRTAGYRGAVTVQLSGLPKGYRTKPVKLHFLKTDSL